MASIDRLLVADIGGTHSRVAIISSGPTTAGLTLSQRRQFENRELSGVEDLLQRFLIDLDDLSLAGACLAVAGPVQGRQMHMTNIDWHIDADRLRQNCKLPNVQLVNDFAALSAAVPRLVTDDWHSLHEPGPCSGPISVVGPGTGLGVGLLVPCEPRALVISTEGGHMAFAPADDLERELHRALAPDGGYLPIEKLLSGAGLLAIDQFLRASSTDDVATHHSPAAVVAAALSGSDTLAAAAVDRFLAILGSTAADIALLHGSTGGVYLAGGILPRIVGLLSGSSLLPRFFDRGPRSDYLRAIPVRLITAPDVALFGAAALYEGEDWMSQHARG